MDFLARRYSKLPSEIKSLSMTDYQFNQLVAFTAAEIEEKEIKKAQSKGSKSGKRAKFTYNQVSS
jgi:hypothetical protein